jgi:hypothetical protein
MYYVPLVKKTIYKEGILVERALPHEGKITVSVGDTVEPSDKLGTCKVVHEIVKLGDKFKVNKREDGSNYYANEALVGSLGRNKFYAPFSGLLEKSPEGHIFKSEEKDYWLLPGVWGKIKDISQNRSVLIETQTVDIHIPVNCGKRLSGELVVFPNPSEMLAVQYFSNYLKTPEGKVVYVGNHVSLELIKNAQEKKVKAVLAGSAAKDAYDFAVENNISLGLFLGFGSMNAPDIIFNFLNEVSNRNVLMDTEKNLLQVPVPADGNYEAYQKPSKILKYTRKGMTVQVLNSENFGQLGEVDRISKSGIFVKLHENNEEVKVLPPNLLIIE